MFLSPEGQRLCGIHCGDEYFAFRGLPFGVPSAPSIYQSLNNTISCVLRQFSVPNCLYIGPWFLLYFKFFLKKIYRFETICHVKMTVHWLSGQMKIILVGSSLLCVPVQGIFYPFINRHCKNPPQFSLFWVLNLILPNRKFLCLKKGRSSYEKISENSWAIPSAHFRLSKKCAENYAL